jgi:hypothetical protein
MEIKEAIEQLRKEKTDPTKPAYLIYSMIQTAHPTVVEMIEYQAAQALVAGEKMKNTIIEASQTEEGREQLDKGLQSLLAKFRAVDIKKPGGDQDG